MIKKKLGIGAQSFKDFAEEDRIYVDKTFQIYTMMEIGKHNFIIRPRRFGKSLFLDTLGALYEGKKDLFEETWVYDKVDWEAVKRPVLRIDFTVIEYQFCSLEQGLQNYLASYALDLGLSIANQTAKDLFRNIIMALAKENSIVILVDEYEMAVTDFVGKDERRMQENIDTLKKFFGSMKGLSNYIHRSYITGVSKIGQIGILSDLNMLNDLTMDERFTTLFGYTEPELRKNYAEYITEGAKRWNLSEINFLALIKQHYNGYSWDGLEQNKVYNPFSIVNFFQSFKFENFWFATGTPTLLVRGARQSAITFDELSHFKASVDFLKSANLRSFYSEALLFQTGYLTIKKVERWETDETYELGFPNQEVRSSFAKFLLAEYVQSPIDHTDRTLALRLRLSLETQTLTDIFPICAPVLASVGYDITKHTEGFFHTVMHVLFYSTGLVTFLELQSAQGRLDMFCVSTSAIYLFEFKINASAKVAIQQIKDKNYAAQFLQQPKTVYLIGINFQTEERKINDIEIEKWNGEVFEAVTGDFMR